MTSPIIELKNLTKKYGNFTAVDNLNLSVEKGEIFGLLGPNGAGKSTSILMMLGLTEPSAGHVNVCGINSSNQPVEVKKEVGYLPEDVGFYNDRSGLENLIYTAQLNGISKKEARKRAKTLMKRVGLQVDDDKKTGKYSKGMRQRLGLADVLMKNPEVIILDEPTSGIDPKGVNDFLSMIEELRNEHGITILFSSHNLHQVQQVCDRVGIFVSGKLLAEGDIETLSKQLFTHGLFQVELGIEEHNAENSLPDILLTIDEVIEVSKENDHYFIQCSSNISSKIAHKIINEGFELNFLNRKEYGLDAIYNRYFEGGLNNG